MKLVELPIPLAIAAAVVMGGCGVAETGTPPPNDALYYPVGIVAHPDGRYLYISNAVFDRKFNAGTITVYDTFARRLLPHATRRTGLFAGELAIGRFAADGKRENSDLMLYTVTRENDQLLALQVNAGEGDHADHLSCEDDANGLCVPPWTADRLERTSSAQLLAEDPFGIHANVDGLFLTHVGDGVVSYWGFDQQPESSTKWVEGQCRIKLPQGAGSVAAHPILNWAYVTDRFGNTIQTIERLHPLNRGERGVTTEDPCRLELRNEIVINHTEFRGGARGLAFSADGTLLYVAGSFDGSLLIYDTSIRDGGRPRNAFVDSIPIGSGPNVVRVAGLRPGESRAVVEPNTGSVNPVIDEKGGGLVYVTDFNEDRVSVIDPQIRQVVARIDVGDGPNDITFAPDGEEKLWAYVTNFADHTLSVIDIEPGSPTRFDHVAVVP